MLEEGQKPTPPQVTIFAPSQNETKEKDVVTLVCLAKDFIPDHVNITWYLYDEQITTGIKTEEFSKFHKDTKSYSLTSRLRVSKQEWQNSNNQFLCKVQFYVNDIIEIYESAISCEGCDSAKESYKSSSYIASFVYVLLIFKSTLYGAFVMGLTMKKKRVQ